MPEECGHDHTRDIAKVVAIWKMCVAYAGANVNDFTEYIHANGVKVPREHVGEDIMYVFDLTDGLGRLAYEQVEKSDNLDLSNLLKGL